MEDTNTTQPINVWETTFLIMLQQTGDVTTAVTAAMEAAEAFKIAAETL